MKRLALLAGLVAMAAGTLMAAEEYPLTPDSQRQAGVPQGTVTHYTWTSKIFPGTTRDYWVYVPAQYEPAKPACVMVFQDGGMFIKEDGRARAPIVFDNLIAKHQMPVTIGIFINPGVLEALTPGQQNRYNRSFEYDALGDRYAHFLLDEILPEAAKHYNLATSPDDRAIAGLSSGGICAFTVAWTHPEAFHRVLSFIGSFTDLRGGDIYPALIRKTEPKPLRVFLQDGDHDLNLYAGSWWLANQSMASALEWAGYDVKFVTGDKDHDMIQGGAILPDALRWLWRDYPQPIAKPAPNHSDTTLNAILDPSHEWELVTPSKASRRALAASAKGEIFSSDVVGKLMEKVGLDGKVSVFKGISGSITGMAFAADGGLYACDPWTRRIVAYTAEGSARVVAGETDCRSLALTHGGSVYFTDPVHGRVWQISPTGQKLEVDARGSAASGGITFSPDESLVFLSDPRQKWIWSFQVQKDGSFGYGEPFYRLDPSWDVSSETGAKAMTVDSLGYLYVATWSGIQVCDQPGRVVAIINPPALTLDGIAFGGPDFQDLYVIAGDQIFKRHLLRKGVPPGSVEKPPVPHL
jgi:gluconolactonase